MTQARSDHKDAVEVGRVLGLHGTSGQVTVRTYSDVPLRFEPGQSVYCNGHPLRIASAVRSRSDQVILKLEGIDSPEAARSLVGQWLTHPPESTPQLAEGEYFHFQLLGLRVLTEEGEELGEITEIIETGSNDVYVVTSEQGQVLIPAIAAVVRDVKLAEGVMVIRLMEGLR